VRNNPYKSLRVTVVLILAILLAACSKGNSNTQGASPSSDTSTKTTTKAEATTAADTASPSPSKDKIKLKIYAQHFDDDTKKPYDYAEAELKKEMPNVELILDPMMQDDGQKLRTYAASGNMPDLFQADFSSIQAFAASKNIEVLDNAEPTAAFKKDLNPGNESKLAAPDGHIYAYPFAGTEFQILFYNKKLFADAGVQAPIKTYDEWKDAIKKFKAKGLIPMAIFAKEKWIGNSFYKGLLTREEPKGYAVLDQKGLTTLPEPFKLAAKQFNELKEAGLFDANATNTNYDQASSQFYTEKAAMFVNGQWEIYSAAKNLGDKVDWMYWPAKDVETYEKMKFYMDGTGEPGGFSVSPASKNKDVAIKVAAFMARKYAEFKYTKLGNPIVALKVNKPVEVKPPAMMQRLIDETLPNIKGFAQYNQNMKVNNAIDDNAQNLIIKGVDDKQFTKDMERVLSEANK
jgi:raffinose/stachyose/melibiose transport system substrate-binding protein